MIKLVAADLDGTLLDSKKCLPAQIHEVIRALAAKGTRFAAASGRQYDNLKQIFPELAQEMLFIAENGAMVFDGGKLLAIGEIPFALLAEPVRLARSLPRTYVILCGEKSAWLEADDPVFRENAGMYYASLTRVDDVMEAARHDRICKIAVFHAREMEQEIYPALLQFEGQFQVALSGDSWVDFMMPGVNKGSAMQTLQKKLGITPDECMAFGDYLNDCELMQAVTHSYGMENGHPDLLAVCRYRAPSNDENGVLRTIMREFDI